MQKSAVVVGMTDPLVSIIIPCFNAAAFIKEALQSVLEQTHSNIEVILVNDGSTDSTESILLGFHDQRIKYLSQPNSGQCVAANAGLSNATGAFIKFFDADDIMHPRHIEAQLQQLEGRTGALCCCAWARFYNNDLATSEFVPENNWRNLAPLEWVKSSMRGLYDMMPGWCWLIPRQLIDQAGSWDERLSLNNDFEFSTRLLMHADHVYFAAEAILYYRSGQEASLSHIHSEQAFCKAVLSSKLGCTRLLQQEDSKEMRLLCANKYAFWLYQVYPQHPSLVQELEHEIALLGGTNRKIDESPLMHRLQDLVGWKGAKNLKSWLYKLGYKKYLLTLKKKLFPPTISHR